MLLLQSLCAAQQASYSVGGGVVQGEQALYDDLYKNGQYADKHWDVGTQASLLHDVLIADVGPYGKLFPDDVEGVVLDAGAGRGAVLHWLEKVQKYQDIKSAMGIEISKVAVEKTYWPHLLTENNLVQGSLAAIPWANRTFDLVYSHEVLEHIPEHLVPACLSEMVRVAKEVLILTISLRHAGADAPDAPHLHVTCRSRRWWDDEFAKQGCYPHLELLAFFWRDHRSTHDTHIQWEPYREPWIFAYRCPELNRNAEDAFARLELMRMLPASPRSILDDGESETVLDQVSSCSSDGWCDVFHPSVYHFTEADLIRQNGRSPPGGWLAGRHSALHQDLYGF